MRARTLGPVVAHARPLLERESTSRGTLALLVAILVAAGLLATLQLRFQSHELASAELWLAQPLGADPAAALVGWIAAALAFRTAVSRVNTDAESLWTGTLHAQGFRAWSYALAVFVVATLSGVAAIGSGYAGLALARQLNPSPEWVEWPWTRMVPGSVLLAAIATAIGTLAAVLVRGTALATGIVVTVLGLPMVLHALLVARGVSNEWPLVPYLYRILPPLRLGGGYELLLWQGSYTLALLAVVVVISGTCLTRRF